MKLYCNSAIYHLNIHQNKPGLPWMLLFHGFMGSSKAMEPLAGRLTGSCNPVTIDLLGHGKSSVDPDPERFRPEMQITDIQSVLDRLQLKNLFIYGYSMGGRLAQLLLASDPSRFSGAILESAHCGIEKASDRQNRSEIDEKRAVQIETDFDNFLDNWIKLPLFDSPLTSSEVNYEQIQREQSPGLMAASLRGFGAGVVPGVCQAMAELTIPTGLVAGQTDQKYVDKMSEMAQLWAHSELNIIENAGHRVHADSPGQLAKFITQFLNKNG